MPEIRLQVGQGRIPPLVPPMHEQQVRPKWQNRGHGILDSILAVELPDDEASMRLTPRQHLRVSFEGGWHGQRHWVSSGCGRMDDEAEWAHVDVVVVH